MPPDKERWDFFGERLAVHDHVVLSFNDKLTEGRVIDLNEVSALPMVTIQSLDRTQTLRKLDKEVCKITLAD